MKRVTVSAKDQDGLNVVNYIFEFEVEDSVDFMDAVKKASREYCLTPDGKKTYSGNCHNFNWGDFDAYVPDEICQKFGIRKVSSMSTVIDVDFNEQLVNEEDIFPSL